VLRTGNTLEYVKNDMSVWECDYWSKFLLSQIPTE